MTGFYIKCNAGLNWVKLNLVQDGNKYGQFLSQMFHLYFNYFNMYVINLFYEVTCQIPIFRKKNNILI